MMEARGTHFAQRHPAFDGRCNLYAAKKSLFKNEQLQCSFTIPNPGKAIEEMFNVTITLVNPNLTMQTLYQYMKMGSSSQ